MSRRRAVRMMALAVGLALLLPTLTSCWLLVGTTADLVPVPDGVAVLQPPQITSCDATFIRSSCTPHYERVCHYVRYWQWWWGWQWRWSCYNVWKYTDCWGDISLRIAVNDPSDDLHASKSPRVRVFDSEPLSATGGCTLAVARQDIPITVTDVTGAGPMKTVTVRVRGISMRFTSQCLSVGAMIPVRIVFNDGGEEMASVNELRASVRVDRP